MANLEDLGNGWQRITNKKVWPLPLNHRWTYDPFQLDRVASSARRALSRHLGRPDDDFEWTFPDPDNVHMLAERNGESYLLAAHQRGWALKKLPRNWKFNYANYQKHMPDFDIRDDDPRSEKDRGKSIGPLVSDMFGPDYRKKEPISRWRKPTPVPPEMDTTKWNLDKATSELAKATGIRQQRGGPYEHPHKRSHGHGSEIKYHHHGKYGKHPADQHHTVNWDNKFFERPSNEHYHTHDNLARHTVGRQHITHLGIMNDYHQHGAYSPHPVTRHHVHE